MNPPIFVSIDPNLAPTRLFLTIFYPSGHVSRAFFSPRVQKICSELGSLLLLLPTTKSQCLRDTAQSKASQQLVDAQPTEKAVDQPTKTEPVQKLTDQTKHTSQEKTDGGNDLEQRFRQKSPERVEGFLRVWHVGYLLLCIVDGLDDGGR